MTSKNLTADDLADYVIIFAEPHGIPRTVRAAYVATEPDWLVFKDHQHRTVAQVNRHLVVMVERSTPEPLLSDEDRIRDAMAEAQERPGRLVTR